MKLCTFLLQNSVLSFCTKQGAGQRVKQTIQRFLERKLKLKINVEKSVVDRPWRRKFLGFSFTPQCEACIRLAPKSIQRFKQKIRQLTNPNWSIAMEERIEKLNQYMMGWIGYFALIETPSRLCRKVS
nr:group II intron maturase-specific domain-containing protein [Caldalkalibacillus thermarum]